MLTILAVLGVLLVIFVVAVAATREDQALLDAPADVADVALPARPLHAADVHAVRLGVTVRGYRMAEVDQVLERLADELAARDRVIEELSAPPAPAPPAPADPACAAPPAPLVDAPAPTPQIGGAEIREARSSDEISFPDVLPADPAGDPESAHRD